MAGAGRRATPFTRPRLSQLEPRLPHRVSFRTRIDGVSHARSSLVARCSAQRRHHHGAAGDRLRSCAPALGQLPRTAAAYEPLPIGAPRKSCRRLASFLARQSFGWTPATCPRRWTPIGGAGHCCETIISSSPPSARPSSARRAGAGSARNRAKASGRLPPPASRVLPAKLRTCGFRSGCLFLPCLVMND